jgi:hypothetical protein
LKPTSWVVGIKILQKSVAAAVPEKRFVPTTVAPAARKGNPVIPMPKPPITPRTGNTTRGSREDIPQGMGRAIHQTTAQTKVAKAIRPLYGSPCKGKR